MREEKYYKINKSKKICILLVSILVLIKKNNGYAAITVGGSSQGAYQSIGSCQQKDRTCTILTSKFIDYLKAYAGSYVSVKFNYKDSSAWEQDMKPGTWSNDSIDDVNFMIFSGHGYKKGKVCSYNTLHYYNLNSFTDFPSFIKRRNVRCKFNHKRGGMGKVRNSYEMGCYIFL